MANINDILDTIKSMLEEAGFENVVVDIQGKADDNTYMVKVEIKGDEEKSLGLLPLSFDTLGGEMAVVIPNDSVETLAAKAGYKRYKVAGVSVYASDEVDAIKKIAKRVKYPIRTSTSEIITGPEGFIEYYTTAIRLAKKATEETEENSTLSEIDILLNELQKELEFNPNRVTEEENVIEEVLAQELGLELNKTSVYEGADKYLDKALELAKSDQRYREFAYKMFVKGGILPLDPDNSAYIVYGELGPEFLATKKNDYRFALKPAEYQKLKELESEITGIDKRGSVYPIEKFMESTTLDDIFLLKSSSVGDEIEAEWSTQKRASVISNIVVEAIKNTASSYGLTGKNVEFALSRVPYVKGNELHIDGEIRFDNKIVAWASITEENGKVLVNTPIVDIFVREYNIKKYKLGSVEGYATSEEEFIEKAVAEDGEIKESGLAPVHIVGEDQDSKITFWTIKEENGNYYLERLDVQSQ